MCNSWICGSELRLFGLREPLWGSAERFRCSRRQNRSRFMSGCLVRDVFSAGLRGPEALQTTRFFDSFNLHWSLQRFWFSVSIQTETTGHFIQKSIIKAFHCACCQRGFLKTNPWIFCNHFIFYWHRKCFWLRSLFLNVVEVNSQLLTAVEVIWFLSYTIIYSAGSPDESQKEPAWQFFCV